jgi:hypothetical protein
LEKGNDQKAGYHSIELGYYAYLYGKLFVKKEPVTLFYSISAQDHDRSFTMKPIELSQGRLRIKQIMLDGVSYANFDANQLVLTLPSGTGGVFAVTYEVVTPTVVAQSPEERPRQFTLGQNYPNPFNPSTLIHYQLPNESRVRLSVYNVLGQAVRSLLNTTEQPSEHTVQFDATGLPSGIYFYCLDAASISDPTKHFTQTRKMVLIK